MCLSVPGRVLSIGAETTPRMGVVEFGAVHKEVCLDAVPTARIGDFVLVHVGYALTLLNATEADALLALLHDLAAEMDS
jgi:hydrogenase expression/formation protein HypC